MIPCRRQLVAALMVFLLAGCGGGGGFNPDLDSSVDTTGDVTGDGTSDPTGDGTGDPVGDVPTECADDDGDGVCNEDDVCEGGDDTVDTDGDTIPDFCDCEGLTCGANAHCEDLGSGPECVCDDGYEGDGTTCTDIDECSLGTDTCDANATCTNTDGGYTCACNSGWDGDGFTCTDVDECTLGTDTCDANATCTNTDGGYTCACNSGWDGDGYTCTDIDECTLGTDTCDTNATCTNTDGGYTCACNSGWDGDGYTCTDIDECSLGTDTCDTNATCTNTDGGYTCACNTGYSGDGYTCTAIDHCALGTDTCDTNATCTYTGPGTYSCACNSGYTGDGYTCTPILTGCDSWSDSFTGGATPTSTQCTDWLSYTAGLATSGYSSVTMSGTFDTTGITCSDPAAAQSIADALRTNTSAIVSCDGHQWSYCNWGGSYGELWIDPPSLCSGSNCPNPGYMIRPCIGNSNWGGVATATCGGPSQTLNLEFCGSRGCTLTGTPDPATVLGTIDQTYYFSNNLVNSIWHGPSNQIIGGHYSQNGYYSFTAGTGGYPRYPDNDTGVEYDRMVHVPATNTAIRTDNEQYGSPYNRIYVGTIDAVTGALSGFATAVFGDGFTGTCHLISSSATEFLCFDGTAIRHYATTEGSASLSLGSTVTLATAPAAPCTGYCFGGTFGWDGMYYYFAYSGSSSTENRYQVYNASGTLVGTYSATPSGGGVNSVYFDWSVCRYATHSGYGSRGGGSEYTWTGGSTDDDSQVYGPVSTYHTP